MSAPPVIDEEEVDRLYARLHTEAEEGGYHLNPDVEFVKDLLRGILVNQKRHGYWGCPCRLMAGIKEEDLDVICPCDYRDPDLEEHGACYCALYVTDEVLAGTQQVRSIPERRPDAETRSAQRARGSEPAPALTELPYPVWRCKVCGYLCARDGPPHVCPVCKAKKDRFERFL